MDKSELVSFLITNNHIKAGEWQVHQITTGAASENFRLTNGTETIFCKILPKREALQFVQHIAMLKGLSLCPQLLSAPFPVGNKTGLLMENKAGRLLRPTDLTTTGLDRLIRAYRQFSDTLNQAPDKSSVLPVRDFRTFKEKAISNLKQHQTSFNRGITQKILTLIEQIPDTAITPDPNKLRPIHGDFTMRNVLIDSDNNLSFLDLEGMRFGHVTEDFSRFIFCATDRIIFPHHRQAFLDRILPQLMKELPYSPDDWRYGIYAFLLRKVARATLKPIGYFKLLKLYLAIRPVWKHVP